MMVSGSKIDGPRIISDDVRETIQSIKEVVGNHSDADIYVVLEESNMDPHESVQKLLFQDPFHEVKRRKDKKKEAFKGSSEPRKVPGQNTAFKGSSEPRKLPVQNTTFKGSSEPRKLTEQTPAIRSNAFPVRNARRVGYTRNSLPGISREFRVVRDNRVNQKPAIVQSTSASVPGLSNDSGKTPIKNSTDQKHTSPKHLEVPKSSQSINGPSDLARGQSRDPNSNSSNRKGVPEESRGKVTNSASPSQGMKPHSSQVSTTSAMNNTVVGLYSSSSDPVHVPSNSRSSGAVGAIRREVGVVGIRRQSSDNSSKHSAVPTTSVLASVPAKDTAPSSELQHPSGSVTKNDQQVQAPVSESAAAGTSLAKTSTSNQHAVKAHQQPMGHQKATQPNMEWKPKSSQKSSFISPVVIRTTATPVPSPNYISTDSKKEADELQEKLSQVKVSDNEHVFIPEHLRVPEADRPQLTFGSFDLEIDPAKSFPSVFQGLENQQQQFSSTSCRAPSSSSEEVNQVDLLNGQGRNSGSASPASTTGSEHPSPDKTESLSPGNLENYVDIGTVRNDSPSYTPAEPQQRQDPPLPSFTAYDPQTGYDMQFYRPLTDESARSQSVPSQGEVLNSHVANSIPGSSVAMVQQQTVPQLYPQVHVSHYPSFMPYRQFISPVYVPPMGVPGYSGNPGYPHPPNGSSYLLVPGGSSHLAAGGLKYGSSQYKPIPPGTPTAYGSYSNPTGYAFNTQGTVGGGATSLDDSTRMKYKDGNLYVPNPQAETSEMWHPTQREMTRIPSAPYYNIPGQPPHPAFMPPHSAHASFNGAATAQPTHMQFSGLYHPSQQAAMANPHHLVPNMGSNVGVAAAAPSAGAQIGAYQQPQLGHMNWNTNF